jgi:tetratricopeptide (TPR) repeat protein
LSAGAGIAAALVIGLAVAVYGLYQSRAQRDRAMQASEQAAKESSHNLAVSQFLSQMLLLVNPEQAKLAEVSLQSVQARGRELFGENHVVIAAVLSSRGTALRLSGQYDEAERAFYEALAAYRKAYGAEHGTVAASLASIGAVMKERGDYTGSESAYRQSLEMKRRLFGPRSKAAAEACQSLAEVLVLRYGPAGNDPQEMKALLYDAYQGYRETAGPKDRKTLEAMISLGVWLQRADMETEAEPILVEAIALGPEVLGNRSELLLTAMDSKVKLYMKQKDTAAAKQSFMDLNTAVRDMFGSRNPLAMNAALQLGQYLMTVDDLGLAENVLRRAIDAAGTTVKRGDPMLTQLKGMLVEVMRRQKNIDKTALRSVWLEYLEDRQTQWGPEEPRLVPLYVDAAFVLLGWGFNSDAEGLYRHIIPMQKSGPSPNQFAIADSLLGLSKALLANNRPVDAETAAREALDIRRRVLREGDWQIAEALAVLGECLVASGRYDEAGPLLDEASHVLDGSRLAPVEAKHRASAALVKLYSATNKPVQAAELQQKITASTQPTTAPAR